MILINILRLMNLDFQLFYIVAMSTYEILALNLFMKLTFEESTYYEKNVIVFRGNLS
jgi:hypothetical protein